MEFLHSQEGIGSPVGHFGGPGCVSYNGNTYCFIDPLLNNLTRACPVRACYKKMQPEETALFDQGKGWYHGYKQALGDKPSEESLERSQYYLNHPQEHPLPQEIIGDMWPKAALSSDTEPLMRWFHIQDVLQEDVYKDIRYELAAQKIPLVEILREDLLAPKSCMQGSYNLVHNGVGPNKPGNINEEQSGKFKQLARLIEHLLVRICGGNIEKMQIGQTELGKFENLYIPGYFKGHKMGDHTHIKVLCLGRCCCG